MANTIIQIKRSSVTATPTGGSLATAEQAYSYNSNKLFIGDAAGTGVIAIGGKFFVDQQNTIFDIANAAYNAANSAGSLAVINLIFDTANAAYNKANAANVLAYNTGIGANAYASQVGVSANAYGDATFYAKTGGTVSGDMVVTGNLTVSGLTTYTNTNTLLVGDNIITLNADVPGATAPTEDAGIEVNRGSSANVFLKWNETSDKWTFTNDGTNYRLIASNTDVEGVAAGANGYASAVGTSANAFATTIGASSNAWANAVGVNANTYASSVGVNANTYASAVGVAANAYASAVGTSANAYATVVGTSANAYARVFANTVGTSANAYADVVGAAANTNAANGSYISAGIVKVPYGGTGLTTFTQNGIVFGNTAGDLKVTAAGTEGQVLQASITGVPQFGMLDGGSF